MKINLISIENKLNILNIFILFVHLFTSPTGGPILVNRYIHARKWKSASTTLKRTLKTDRHMQQSSKLNFIYILFEIRLKLTWIPSYTNCK